MPRGSNDGIEMQKKTEELKKDWRYFGYESVWARDKHRVYDRWQYRLRDAA
jgi:hypothetical protein